MFTGIIRYTGKVLEISNDSYGKSFKISFPPSWKENLEAGISSIAINGACHTVVELGEDFFMTFSSLETLSKTVMNLLEVGEVVNLEMSLSPSSLLDGHLVQGHVDTIAKITALDPYNKSPLLTISLPKEYKAYLVEKDSISINGISLTLFDIREEEFSVAVIPATIEHTNLKYKKAGDFVNIEINIFAKYIYAFSQNKDRNFLNWNTYQ